MKPSLLTLFILVLVGSNYFAPFSDLDFGWQIRTGERIVETRRLQPPEAFSYTINGSHVPDFEWLYEVTLWLVWNLFGQGGLKFLRLVLVATPFWLVGKHLQKSGVQSHGVILALLLGACILAPTWNLRPMFCTTIGLLVVTCWLHHHCTGKKPLSGWLPVVMFFWGNLHPGVIAGQVLLLAAICWEWMNSLVRINPPLEKSALKRLTWLGGGGLAASMLSPNPLERFFYPFRPELRHSIQQVFAEMQPLIMKPWPVVVLAFALGLAVTFTVIQRFRQFRLWEVGLLAGLAFLANKASRGLSDWVLVMLALGVPVMAGMLTNSAKARGRPWLLRLDRSCKRIFQSPGFRFQLGWMWAAAVLFGVISIIPPLSRGMPIQNRDNWPVAAVAHIEKLGLRGKFFGPPDYGSFLIWRLPGQARAYTDTRGFFYPPELLEDSHFLPQLGPDWQHRLQRVLEEYKTDYFLLETNGPRGALWRNLKANVGTPLFLDEISVLLTTDQVKKGLPKNSVH